MGDDKVAAGKTGAERSKAKRARDEAEAARVAALPAGDEDDLAVMRHVKRSQVDLTYQHWESRQWKKRNEDKWQGVWADLERAERASRPPRPTEGQPAASSNSTTESPDSSSVSPPKPGESCPTCGRVVPIPDPQDEKVDELIRRLLAGEA